MQCLFKTKVVIATTITGMVLVSLVGINYINCTSNTSSVDQHIQVFGGVYQTQYGVTTASSLSVRTGAATKYSSVANMKKGTKVVMIGKTNNFYKITYGGKTRYISSQYVKITAKPVAVVYKTQYGVTTASSLSVRTGAGTNYSIQGNLKSGTNVNILGKANNFYKITYGAKTGYVSALYIKIIPQSKLLIDKIKNKGNAKQAIVVTTSSYSNVNATITTFENVNGIWRQIASFAGNVGNKGFIYNKVEGDGRSPIGVFSLGTAFGRYANPGISMTYRISTTNDFWVDDIKSPLYNTWQKGPVSGRWNSAENMYIPQYNYGFVINYNTAKRVSGKGSGIFFHVWSGAGHGTAGCTATAQTNVINTLKWLKPSKSPIIIEGPMSEVLKM